MNILEEIAQKTRERVAESKKKIPPNTMRARALSAKKEDGFAFTQALRATGISFICEVKKASPSKGLIAKDFPYTDIAKSYADAGANAISVLTEPAYFLGANKYLEEIHETVSLPLLRKDFTVDPYMIDEAKVIGASAVLLICAILSDAELKDGIARAKDLGLTALVEAHDEAEAERALNAGAEVVGVNNRDLKTFTVDLENSIRLRSLVPEDVLFVSESGIKTAEDVKKLKENRVDAVLVGETLMRAGNVKQTLANLRGC